MVMSIWKCLAQWHQAENANRSRTPKIEEENEKGIATPHVRRACYELLDYLPRLAVAVPSLCGVGSCAVGPCTLSERGDSRC